MSIGDELFMLSEIFRRTGEVNSPEWKYETYFSFPDFQPTQEGFKVLMKYEKFWALEPPILAVHVSLSLDPKYYKEALSRCQFQSLVTFGEQLAGQTYHFKPREEWVVPHLMSFCDFHIISDSPDSWWGAILSDNPDVIYPLSAWSDNAPASWEAIEI